jgi:hypothetical protein
MARLTTMPPITVAATDLTPFGLEWHANGGNFTKKQSMDFGYIFDIAIGTALAEMLGGIPVRRPARESIASPAEDCVEVGPVRIVGGVRAQDFDAGYRPDGVRAAFDSKTLNSADSIMKNWRNMINDLATEATTVHSRFPHAVVGFMVVFPSPAIGEPQLSAIIETLERLARRHGVDGPVYMAEAISFALWNPDDGTIHPTIPDIKSTLRIEKFSGFIETAYVNRYKGLPPHAVE